MDSLQSVIFWGKHRGVLDERTVTFGVINTLKARTVLRVQLTKGREAAQTENQNENRLELDSDLRNCNAEEVVSMNTKALIDMIQDYAGFRSSAAVLRAFPFHQTAGELAQISKAHELRADELFAQIETELKKLEVKQ